VGGNVASYFCLGDGTVVHAVPGPVDAKTFLNEARWAVETRKAALTAATNLANGSLNPFQVRAYISQAHEERYLAEQGGAWGSSTPFTRAQNPQALARNLSMLPGQLPRTASRQSQVEWLLAINPLPPLDRVYPFVWEQILSEKLSTLPVAQR
jgi:hypothetical protein